MPASARSPWRARTAANERDGKDPGCQPPQQQQQLSSCGGHTSCQKPCTNWKPWTTRASTAAPRRGARARQLSAVRHCTFRLVSLWGALRGRTWRDVGAWLGLIDLFLALGDASLFFSQGVFF